MKNTKEWVKGAAFAAVVIALGIFAHIDTNSKVIDSDYLSFMGNVDSGNVSAVTLTDGEKIMFTLRDDTAAYRTDNPRTEHFKETLLNHSIAVSESNNGNILQLLVSIAFFTVAFLIARKVIGKGGGAAMALNPQNRQEAENTDFSRVAGNEEVKDSVKDIVGFIKNPEKYLKLGARMPRGIIFYGPPGTGKTLMARAIAGEAGVPFYALSGSDFVQMYVGVGAARIRELFKKARESKKAVIFIDEIDALGKKRGNAAVGGNDEREQTLNALLTEMSGFAGTDGVVVVAATNRLDTLDDALLRPGRFDRQIEISLPDLKSRENILEVHSKNKPLDDIDLHKLAKSTVYFSGAMLENLLNEAAIMAANRESATITDSDIDHAFYTVIAGSEKKDRSSLREKDRRITAFHEAGHALLAKTLSPENTVSKITIIPSTKGAGGFCVNIPPDKMYMTKQELKVSVMINYAGRAAEELIFGEDDITTGASSDIENATKTVRDFVTRYGMGRFGLLNMELIKDDKAIATESIEIAQTLYDKTKDIIRQNMDKLNSIANALLERETLNEDELDEVIFQKNACA
ncbi:ATP-dependent zinc metalloprotease FtsH [Clostridia bacterium]|nr:ATP-dependent zinc metalloprotease FtsH [Clostridia bacterium]